MSVWAIANGTLVFPDRLVEDGVVLVDGDRIAACGPAEDVPVPPGIDTIDARGRYVGPGFIDIHSHGGGGYWSFDHPLEAAEAHLRHGTTGYLPTPVYFQTREELLASAERIAAVMRSGAKRKGLILGMHLEGPFLNPKYGALRTNIRPVDPEEYRELLHAAGPYIKVWTVAPEMPGTNRLIEETAAAFPGVVFSAGHSESDPETMYRLVPHGLRLACHLTNASGTTPAVSRFGGTLEVGLHEAALAHDDMFVEVIPDRGGAHVRPLMLKLILKAKGIDRVVVITDAVNEAAAGELAPPPAIPALNDFPGCDDVNFTEDGQLNGSKLTMDRAVRNMMRHTGTDLVGGFRMGSLNPARLLGLDGEMGSLAPGKRANLVIVDEAVEVHGVVFEGEWVRLEMKAAT